MNQENMSPLDKLKEEINQFLKTGDQRIHLSILEQLGLDGSDVNYGVVERLLEFLDFVGDTNTQIFLANAIKQIIILNYSVFSTDEKKCIYNKAFEIYKKMPHNSYFLQDLVIKIFKFFYDSIQLEVSFIEDVKVFCEQSVEHLQLGLQLFSNILHCMQDYQMKYKCSQDLAYIDYNSDLSQFHRKKEISFRQNLLPQIFDIPFQLLNTKREDLMSEQETNFSVLLEVLNLLYNCLNYDYFDQKKVTDEKFVVELSILSIPCREKKQDNGYLNDLKSQDFTNTLFELYYYMINKHKEISIKCLQIISLLIRLSIKFFKKEDQKFSQMIFIIDGLHKIMQTHAFIFQESDVFEQTEDIFQAFCLCVSKIPIGLSFSDGENLQGFWEFVQDTLNITRVAIEKKKIPCIELLLEFWCGYDYFLGHDGAQKQEQLRGLVEKILKQLIKTTHEVIGQVRDDQEFEETLESYSLVIKYFGQLSNTWIDLIEEILMKKIGDIFDKRSQTQTIALTNKNIGNIGSSIEGQSSQYYHQLTWLLTLIFTSQSYNIKEELSTTNKHYELDSQDEIKEDLDILHQAFESFGKLFQIILNLFKSSEEMIPTYLTNLIIKIYHFMINLLSFRNHINFDYLLIIIKFTDLLELKNYFYLNYIIGYFLDSLLLAGIPKNAPFIIETLELVTKSLQATDQGVQIGCFPFDLPGFFESEIMKKHKESAFDCLEPKQIQDLYQYIFTTIDKHEQYKKILLESDFKRIEEQFTLQRIEDTKIKRNSNKLGNHSSGQKKYSISSNKENNLNSQSKSKRDSIDGGAISQSHLEFSSKSKHSVSKVEVHHLEDDIIEIIPASSIRQSIWQDSQERKQSVKVGNTDLMIDYFSIFMNIISSRIQLDEQIPIHQQKNILQNVLHQLIGIVQSSTIHTYSRLIQFVISNNIFYSIKQVIKQENELNADEINCALKFISKLASTRIYINPDLQELLLKEIVEIIIETQLRLLNKSFQQNIKGVKDEWNLVILPLSYQYRIIFNLLQQQMLNFSQLDSQMIVSNMFHCLTVITPEKMSQYHKKLYWIYRSIHLLSQLHFEVFLLLQPLEFNAVTQVNTTKIQFISFSISEFESLSLYTNLEQGIITHITLFFINSSQKSVNSFSVTLQKIYSILHHLDTQQSNFYHVMTVQCQNMMINLSSKRVNNFTHKDIQVQSNHQSFINNTTNNYLFDCLSSLHNIFQNKNTKKIMEEALKVSFDCEEPMEFFINVLNQIFICRKSNNLIMNQYLAYSEETLMKVLQAIVLKVIRNEDLNQKNLYKLMLGYFWMLEREKFISTVNQVFDNFSYQNAFYMNKFSNYVEEIEVLDFKKYMFQDQGVLLDAKIIFKKIFG